MSKTHVKICIALMTAIAGHAVGGEIDPQPGPIAPTMKSLDQIEPRVCINDLPGSQGAVHLITEPGNYYFTADVIGEPGKSGIVVDLNQDGLLDVVTIDMNGYSCVGVPGSLHGIEVPDVPTSRVEKFNVKQEFGQQGGTHRWGGDGVNVAAADECVLLGIDSENNGGAGYRASGGPRFKAGSEFSKKVNIANNGGGGGGGGIIIINCRSASLDNMTIRDNIGDGVNITDSSVTRDQSISMDTIDLYGNIGDGIDITHTSGQYLRVSIRRASIDANAGDGMRLTSIGDESMDASIDEMFATHNGGNGVNIEAFSSASVAVRVTNSSFTSNVLSGFRSHGDEAGVLKGMVVKGSTASGNGGHGFDTVAQDETYTRCEASDNTQDGFHNLAPAITLRPIVNKTILKAYYQTGANRNGGDGLNSSGCILTANVCHFIANGGDGTDITNGEIHAFSSAFDNNSGSGLRASDSPLYVDKCTAGDNALYGIHASNTGGDSTTTITGSTVHSNDSGGVRVEGGHVTCQVCHLISNGGGLGGGTGSGMGVIDAASVCITDSSATGNTGSGFEIDNNSTGIPPIAFKLDSLMASGNGGSGISADTVSFGSLRSCVTNNNGVNGILFDTSSNGMHIESCVASGNLSSGYDLSLGIGHTLVNNAAAGNTLGGYRFILPGNTIGPQVDEAVIIQNGNPGGNYVR